MKIFLLIIVVLLIFKKYNPFFRFVFFLKFILFKPWFVVICLKFESDSYTFQIDLGTWTIFGLMGFDYFFNLNYSKCRMDQNCCFRQQNEQLTTIKLEWNFEFFSFWQFYFVAVFFLFFHSTSFFCYCRICLLPFFQGSVNFFAPMAMRNVQRFGSLRLATTTQRRWATTPSQRTTVTATPMDNQEEGGGEEKNVGGWWWWKRVTHDE